MSKYFGIALYQYIDCGSNAEIDLEDVNIFVARLACPSWIKNLRTFETLQKYFTWRMTSFIQF